MNSSTEPRGASSRWLTGPVISLTYCPDNSGYLAAGGLEGVVRVWNTSGKRRSADDPVDNSGLLDLHRNSRQGLVRQQQQTFDSIDPPVNQSNLSYYSAVAGADVSDACLHEVFYTRRTPVLGLHYAHPYLLLSVGPYNRT